jgi:probable F420-dependent oxidoreductase
MTRKFRFGAVAGAARSGREWAATARRVEELGFSTLLCPDTTFALAPFTALAAAASVTSTLLLGTYVLASPLRTPATVAWETTGLDVLSDGRFELGLGAGRPGSERDAAKLGVPFGQPGERIAQMEETLIAVRAKYSAEDPAPQQGGVRGAQRPHPPILMAGAGPRMLALAAQYADSLALALPPLSTEEDLDAKVRQLREIAGERFDGLELNTNIALIGEDAPPHAASWFGADPKELLRIGAITTLRGTPREMADTLLRRRDRAGVSYVSVNAMFIEQFAPVIELLADE